MFKEEWTEGHKVITILTFAMEKTFDQEDPEREEEIRVIIHEEMKDEPAFYDAIKEFDFEIYRKLILNDSPVLRDSDWLRILSIFFYCFLILYLEVTLFHSQVKKFFVKFSVGLFTCSSHI